VAASEAAGRGFESRRARQVWFGRRTAPQAKNKLFSGLFAVRFCRLEYQRPGRNTVALKRIICGDDIGLEEANRESIDYVRWRIEHGLLFVPTH
jgi:hypothetical protein